MAEPLAPPQPPPAPPPRLQAVPSAPVVVPEPQQPPASWSPERDGTGRFKVGHGGRPLGSKNKKSADALARVQGLSDAAIDKLAELVAQGSFAAIKLVLEHTLPRGGRTIDLDGTQDANKLIEAVTTGQITPDEMARISQGWKTAIDAAELNNIKSSIEELEQLVAALRK